MTHFDLFTAYKYVRRAVRAPIPARVAIVQARELLKSGKPFYLKTESNCGAPFQIGSDSVRWIERPEDCGLRRVGFSDELMSMGRESHRGWFLDDEGMSGEVARGEVFQLSARRGVPRFLSAIADSVNKGAAIVSTSTIAGERTDSSYDENGKADAARDANGMAEIFAESERDYRRAFQAGSRFADWGEDIKQARRAFLELRKESKAAELLKREAVSSLDYAARVLSPPDRSQFRETLDAMKRPSPAVCAALLDKARALLESISEAKQERARLKRGEGGDSFWFNPSDESELSAFNEGAGL